MNEFHRLDITKRVTARISEDLIELYCGKDSIGRLVINEEGKQYELAERFLFEDGRIFKLYERDCGHEQYGEACELGW
ncbi:DUF2553 family protein [Bacillus mangrovi]|uniref:DUF2553 family protein n=1 Tax=Metabacillus mangrovi TaxID=1491830 RepID=A0A7X2S7X6_9BACI|nr:DUF2553 family protein [Metabacillus mangrovi]MTH55369.1 DUF2553 family protein [Metabacillus mangrovi]